MALTEVECLFKEHQRKSHPHIRPRNVAEKILAAFNGDLNYISSGLKAVMEVNGHILPLEDCLRFFEKFKGYQSHYSDEELQVMLDYFVRSKGLVIYRELEQLLLDV